MIAHKGILALLLVGAPALAAWQYRDYIRSHWFGDLAKPKETSIVVYTWRDAKGTLHFEQSAIKEARPVVVDTSRITRLETVKEPLSQLGKQPQAAGSQTLRDLRRENELDQMKMREKMIEQATE